MQLYHYFERARGPFLTIMDLPYEAAVSAFAEINQTNPNLVPQDVDWFLERRRELEAIVREMFAAKGGKPRRKAPHYMTVERADCMKSWYLDPAHIQIGIEEFDPATVSFTYGDMFPVFNPRLDDGREYRRNVYTYDEIIGLIAKYGYPQQTEPPNAPTHCRLKYVEAHIWSDKVVGAYRGAWFA